MWRMSLIWETLYAVFARWCMYLMISSMIHKVLTDWGCYVLCLCRAFPMHFDESSMFAGHKIESKTLKVSVTDAFWDALQNRNPHPGSGRGGSFSMINSVMIWLDAHQYINTSSVLQLCILHIDRWFACMLICIFILTVDLHACSFAYSYRPLICMHAHLHIHIDRWFACMLICIFISTVDLHACSFAYSYLKRSLLNSMP